MKTRWSSPGLICLLLASIAAGSAHAEQDGMQRERREKFRSEQVERREQRAASSPETQRSQRDMQQGATAEEEQRAARERQLERRALLRRQINEAREFYPPPGRP